MTLDQKIAFILSSFVDVYLRHKDYLTADTVMLEELKKKYLLWIHNLARFGKNAIKEIHEMVSVTGGNEQKKLKDHKPLVTTIFKVYHSVQKLRDDVIIDHSEFRQKFLESYERRLNEVVECYKETIKGQPT